MNHRILRIPLAAALSVGLVLPMTVCAALAQNGASSQTVRAAHIRFVYPDSAETSNAPFPPNADPQTVRAQLRTVTVAWRGRRLSLGQYLRSMHMDPSKVVSIKVQGENAAVYTYR